MNNKIEFRAWDRRRGQMLYPTEICFDHSGRVTVFYGVDIDDKITCDQGDVMEFTGLKDKNGKKIYERDVVRIKDANWKVSYLDGSFRLDDRLQLSTEAEHCEVIGNIYENHELLKT